MIGDYSAIIPKFGGATQFLRGVVHMYLCTYNRGTEVTVRFLVIHPLTLFYGIPLHTHLIGSFRPTFRKLGNAEKCS